MKPGRYPVGRRLSPSCAAELAASERTHRATPTLKTPGGSAMALPPPDSFTLKFTVSRDQAAGIMEAAQHLGARPYHIQLGCDVLFDFESKSDPFDVIIEAGR